jgi:hypothetical protein
MVVAYEDTVGRAKALKGKFGINGCGLVKLCHQVNVSEIGEMVNKNSSALVTGSCWRAAMGWNETGSWTDELVDTDNLAREGGRLDGTAIADTFSTLGFAMGFAIGTARAERGFDVSEFSGYEVSAGK